jgi:hypothetical protein
MGQVTLAGLAAQPDRHGPAAGVVGQHDQVASGVESAVGQPSGAGLGVRDPDSTHGRSLRAG